MCEGYWDTRLRRWVSLRELEDEELEALLDAKVVLPTVSPEPKRKPAALVR